MSLALVMNIFIRLAILYFLGEVLLNPDDPRFAFKAIPIRNLIIVLILSLLFPILYFWKKKWFDFAHHKYPFGWDNLYLSIFVLDMAGNSFNLYTLFPDFDLIPHFHSTASLAVILLGAFGFSFLAGVGLANIIHILLEAQEYYTDVFFNTHNVRGVFDVVNDLFVGVLGTILYGLIYLWYKKQRR